MEDLSRRGRPWSPLGASENALTETRKRELLQYLVKYLIEESESHGCGLPPAADAVRGEPGNASDEGLWLAFRSLVNVRPPWPASAEFLAAQDELLQGLIAEAGVATLADTTPSPTDPRLRLWRGDITTLAVDAIVNAANSGMTGCWAPLHYCIDNAIHTFAGVQLRAACAKAMAAQGHPEPTAQAKVTSGYNLPARYVIHTVGPIADGRPTDTHRRQLAESYRACLDAAAEAGLSSIAFCCISTGVFGFPQEEAASIAVATVRRWLDEHPDMPTTVVFNVFSETDESLYRPVLGLV